MDSANGNPFLSQGQIPLPNKQVGDLHVIEVFIVLLVIWVLVDLWVIFFRNLARKTFGLDERNTLHMFAYALAVTGILIGFIILAGQVFQESLINIGAIPTQLDPKKIVGGNAVDVELDQGLNPTSFGLSNSILQEIPENTNTNTMIQDPPRPNILDDMDTQQDDEINDVLNFIDSRNNHWTGTKDIIGNNDKKKKKKKRKN